MRVRRWCVQVSLALAAGIIAFGSIISCGSDSPDDIEGADRVGSVPGQFALRLASGFRDQLDAVQLAVQALTPGLSTDLNRRYGKQSATGEDAKLSDLLALKVPGTESEFINKQLFGQLAQLKDGSGTNFFDLVDTAKYTRRNYIPSAGAAATTEYSKQYYLDSIRWHDAMKSVDDKLATAAPVVVAVLDTGVQASHEDLTGVMWEYSGVVGYDAVTKTELARSSSTDVDGHGTHVAGIIAGDGSNSAGIHGVGYVPGRGGNPAKSISEVMNVRVLDENGAGTSEQITDGLRWAVQKHRAQVAADPTRSTQRLIVNMSLGGPFETEGYSYKQDTAGEPVLVDDVIAWATANDDVLVVVAAGNETCGIGSNCDVMGRSFSKTYYYPCSYKGVLCVAASTNKDTLAGFSNRRSSVGIAAPGYQIISAGAKATNSYVIYNGTSQATPVTAGAAAVVWSLYPDLKASEVAAVIQRSAADIAAIKSEVRATPSGRLDLAGALTFAAYAKSLGKSPNAIDPQGRETVPIEKSAPAGGPDPNAPSADQRSSAPPDKGRGSGGSCAILSADVTANSKLWLGLLLVLGVPVILLSRNNSSQY